jgi:hypothetical protein
VIWITPRRDCRNRRYIARAAGMARPPLPKRRSSRTAGAGRGCSSRDCQATNRRARDLLSGGRLPCGIHALLEIVEPRFRTERVEQRALQVQVKVQIGIPLLEGLLQPKQRVVFAVQPDTNQGNDRRMAGASRPRFDLRQHAPRTRSHCPAKSLPPSATRVPPRCNDAVAHRPARGALVKL